MFGLCSTVEQCANAMHEEETTDPAASESGQFMSQNVTTRTVLSWIVGLVGLLGWLAWGFLVFRIDALESGRSIPMSRESTIRFEQTQREVDGLERRVDQLEARIRNLEDRALWRYDQQRPHESN